MSTLDISLVRRHLVPLIWPKVEAFLARATDLSEGRYDIKDLYERLTKHDDWYLWVVFETEEPHNIIGAITTTWSHYPQMKTVHGQFLGGERLDEWQDRFCDLMEEWGRDSKCDAIEFTGRRGWTRLVNRNGYRPVFVTYQKDLH